MTSHQQSVVWILVTCESQDEAEVIGVALLGKRLIGCYDVLPRDAAGYFWPPQSGQVERKAGVLLAVTTFAERYDDVEDMVKALHGSSVPFIASVAFDRVSDDYRHWLAGEVR